MYFVQLRIAPQNPKTPKIINNELIRRERARINVASTKLRVIRPSRH